MILEQTIKWGLEKPKKLFLIDGTGAIISAILLGLVLVQFEEFFGIPRPTLYVLALFPILFALYDLYCFFKEPQSINVFLKGIAIMNLLYCILSLGLAIFHHQTLTLFGWIYILLEVLIVIALANLEYRVARRFKP